MTEDLQGLLEKINREGVAKARAEADKIIADAKREADNLVKSAEVSATKHKLDSEEAAEDYMKRASETIRQVARDTMLKLEAALTSMLEKLLITEVDKALAREEVLSALIIEAIKSLPGAAEVVVPSKLAPALKATLASNSQFTVITDELQETGFSVKTDGGRVEHSFTGTVVAEELAKRLRPELAKLLK